MWMTRTDRLGVESVVLDEMGNLDRGVMDHRKMDRCKVDRGLCFVWSVGTVLGPDKD